MVSDINLGKFRLLQIQGWIQFNDGSTDWRVHERQNLNLNYSFGRVDHYDDLGQKYRDWAGYTHRFTLRLKLTSDMIDSSWSSASPKTINYWIYQNTLGTPLLITFKGVQHTPETTEASKYVVHTVILDPDTFGDIVWDTTGGSAEITITGEALTISSIVKQSSSP